MKARTKTQTIGQLALVLDLDERKVSKTARRVLGLTAAMVRNPALELSRNHCRLIAQALGKPDPWAPEAPAFALSSLGAGRRPVVRRDPCAAGELTFRSLPHGLWVHPDVPDGLGELTRLRQRLGIVLQHLAAHGRTTVVKGCRDAANRGWRRSPLGGSGGMQYYLWWTLQGSRPARGIDFPDLGGILVRAVRHHDDHEPLSAGVLDDYLAFSQREIEDADLVGRPWTPVQLQFVEHEGPVRLVHGRPGSGKTTVLWKAVEARSGQRVLYLTWSRELTTSAEEHFRAFAPADVRVDARDFATFLGEVCGADVERRPLAESRAGFAAATARLGRRQVGPWAGRDAAIHAEVRAILIGRAVPGDVDCVAAGDLMRLSDAAYRARRAGDDGVGRAAATALLKVAGAIQPEAFGRIFPELAAAAAAIGRLRNDDLPAGFAEFDRVVVDEVQDLTVLETAVVVELCLAIARRRGHAPWLLVAGDDGQTVRPSGFDWGPLNDLLAARLDPPRRFHLEDNLRCPSRIAGVIERASEWYVHLDKGRRPTKQRHQSGGQHVDAHLLHVVVPDAPGAVALLERLDDVEGVVVVSLGDEVPAWVPDRLRDMVLTPSDAKGLEYQSVCVLDPGTLLARLAAGTGPTASRTSLALREHEHRTAIDQLRVALSRATETLVFVDVAGNDDALDLSAELLDDAAPYDPDDLIEHFADEAPPEERVLARTNDARALVDAAPRRAWQRACQAMRLLGDSHLPNGVADETVRLDARTTVLATAARLLVDGVPAGVRRQDVLMMADEAIAVLGSSVPYEQAFRELDAWSVERETAPFALLDATLALGREGSWLRQALPPVSQGLRDAVETFSTAPGAAGAFAGDVEGWLDLTGYAGDAAARARALRCGAADALVDAGETLAAERVLLVVKPPDPARLGRLREAEGRLEEAAETFETADMPADALRNWRTAGKWEQAVRLAEGAERTDLEWLVELDALIGRRPPQQRKRLTVSERERLGRLLDTVQRAPKAGKTATAAATTALIVLPALGPDLPPGFTEAEGIPPVPDKPRTGRFFGRRVMEFQNWTLACNARWRLTDEQLAVMWQAEFPNSRSRYTMKSIRTVRNLFNQGRHNNDAPRTPVAEYDPGGRPVVFGMRF